MLVYKCDFLAELDSALKNNLMTNIPDRIVIHDCGAPFEYFCESASFTLKEKMSDDKTVYLVYRTIWEGEVRPNDIILAWKVVNGVSLQPVGAKYGNIDQLEEAKVGDPQQERIIGTTMDITIQGINGNQPIKCKVDTGATSCSIDAQEIEVIRDNYGEDELVKFAFRGNRYKTKVAGYQCVRSADGGTQNRPTVAFSVHFNNKTYQGVEFNLNDRSGMEYDILLGLNFLSVDQFLIDPQRESVELTPEQVSACDKLFENENPSDPTEEFSLWRGQQIKEVANKISTEQITVGITPFGHRNT